MAKSKKHRPSRIPDLLEKKSSAPQPPTPETSPAAPATSDSGIPAPVSLPSRTAAAETTGSCRYADANGQIQCESPVSQSYCEAKSGFFTAGGRC